MHSTLPVKRPYRCLNAILQCRPHTVSLLLCADRRGLTSTPSQTLGVLSFPLSPPSCKEATHNQRVTSSSARLQGWATTQIVLRLPNSYQKISQSLFSSRCHPISAKNPPFSFPLSHPFFPSNPNSPFYLGFPPFSLLTFLIFFLV